MASLHSIRSLDEGRVRNPIERVFTPSKISRVRWVLHRTSNETQEPNAVVTGSYSEMENSLDLWQYNNQKEQGIHPDPIQSLSVDGDVTELKFVSPNKFLASTAKGTMGLYKVLDDGSAMEQLKLWDCSQLLCETEGFRGFDVLSGSVALATTSGKILCFAVDNSQSTAPCVIDHGKDGMRVVSFVTRNEIAGGNLRGQISVWDMRQDVFTPAISFPYNSEQSISVTQLAQFPTQRHILVGAGADGSLSTWDLRKADSSQTIYAAHRNHVTGLRFHDVRPGNAFSCSFAGDVWHWTNFAELLGASVSMTTKQLSGKMPNVLCLLPEKKFPVNSIDVVSDRLVAAFDNDLLVFINNLQLK